MKNLASLLKPGASRKTHLLIAALIWSGVGVLLLIRGIKMHGVTTIVPLAFAFLVGTLKALFILDRAALRNIRRITALQDGACLGGVYSWKMWLIIGCMILAGRVLRMYGDAVSSYLGLLYVAVGWGLLLASRNLWKQYFRRCQPLH